MTQQVNPPATMPLPGFTISDVKIATFNQYMADGKYRAAYNYARENTMPEYAQTALRAWAEKTLQEHR